MGKLSADMAVNAHRPADAGAPLSTSVDPVFGGFGWQLSALPGEVITGRVSVEFPEPAAVPPESNVYVHVWVSPGSVDPVLGTYLLNVDPRFPRLSEPKVPGLQPGFTQVPEFPTAPNRSLLNFDMRVPLDVEPSVYLGNMCLLRLSPFSVGDVLGRASFAFRVRSPGEPPDLAS
ncbi:hypothetical protein EAH80_20795 [Mycobacterium hodleri]|uniref:Uncharacterized protein n=1 Tax=Mycolicibacterium hodleri TaxID=49897 RepID=A0A502E756_9MYCO|nr:hypothetical protein EAH80_20795 [Mycolicibacterium hodleri]